MKATGIVRRIDDLGRVVIPKEIRRTMRIRVGDPLEIFTNDQDEVVFKKYSTMNSMREFAEELCDVIYRMTDEKLAVADRERIIAASGDRKRDLIDKKLSDGMLKIIDRRIDFHANKNEKPTIVDDEKIGAELCIPLIVEGDIAGAVLVYGRADCEGKADPALAKIAAGMIGRQMEQ